MHKLIVAAAASAGLFALAACAEPEPQDEMTAQQMPGAEALPPADATGTTTAPPVEDPMMPADPNNPQGTPPTLPEDQVSPPAQ